MFNLLGKTLGAATIVLIVMIVALIAFFIFARLTA